MSLITICQIIIGASLAGMLFIFLRNLPFLAEFEPKPILPEKKFFNRIKYNLGKTKTKVGEIFHKFVEKNSHKLRIFILKTDNFLISRARQAREKKIHFAKINFKKKKKEDYLVRKEEDLKKEEEKKIYIQEKKNKSKSKFKNKKRKKRIKK